MVLKINYLNIKEGKFLKKPWGCVNGGYTERWSYVIGGNGVSWKTQAYLLLEWLKMKMLHILSFYEILFSVLSQPVYNVSECLGKKWWYVF